MNLNLRRGVLLALLTSFMWGILALALKVVLVKVSAVTITWLRFLSAFLMLAAYLRWKGVPSPFRVLPKRGRWELIAAAVLLALNFIFYVTGLDYTSPANAQVLIQLGPMLALIAGVFVFRDSFSRIQWIGFFVLVFGLGLFFQQQIAALFRDVDRYLWGSFLIVAAAAFWAVYALYQKYLLKWISSEQILVAIYGISALLFTPMARPAPLLSLTTGEWCALIFCCLNTVIAYGAYGRSLVYLDIARSGAIVAVNPLITMAASNLVVSIWPGAMSVRPIGPLEVFGGVLVVVGSALATLGRRFGRVKSMPQLVE